jgi:hypothetical protein
MAPRRMTFASFAVFTLFVTGTAMLAVFAVPMAHDWYKAVSVTLDWKIIGAAAAVYLASHVLRAARLYVILLEFERSMLRVIGLYATLAVVNIVVAFKLGEIFRLTEFAHRLRSVRLAVVVIATERFFDAVTLLWLLIYGFVIDPGLASQTTLLIITLTTAVIFGMMTYRGLPGFAHYLQYIAATRSGGHRGLEALRFANWLDRLREDLSRLLRGRAVVLAVISFAIWACEVVAMGLIFASTASVQTSDLASSLLLALNSILTVGAAPLGDAIVTYFVLSLVVVLVFGGPLAIAYSVARARGFNAAMRGTRGARAPYIRMQASH